MQSFVISKREDFDLPRPVIMTLELGPIRITYFELTADRTGLLLEESGARIYTVARARMSLQQCISHLGQICVEVDTMPTWLEVYEYMCEYGIHPDDWEMASLAWRAMCLGMDPATAAFILVCAIQRREA